MATLTSHASVAAGQRELGQIVIEVSVFPIGWNMTGGTIGSVFPVVFIILLVTGETVRGRASINAVLMAGLARYLCMFAFQLEDRQIVVKLGRRPSICRVTLSTIGAKAALVRLIPAMA
jgi:hypothetical protein